MGPGNQSLDLVRKNKQGQTPYKSLAFPEKAVSVADFVLFYSVVHVLRLEKGWRCMYEP